MKQYQLSQKSEKVSFIKSLKTWKLEKPFLAPVNVGVRGTSIVSA